MNKKMRELLNSINEKRVQARQLVSEGKKVEAKNLIEEIKSLQEDYDIEAALYEDEKTPNPEPKNKVEHSDEMKRRIAFNKAVLGKNLDPQDKGLVEGTDEDGGFLVPKEQKTQINELRRSQVALKDYCNVIVVHSQAGSMPLEVEASDKLTAFTDEDGGFLVPKEQKTQINELRRSQVALKDYCNVIVVHSQAGSMPLEVEASDKLTAFDELTEINQSDIRRSQVALKDYCNVIVVHSQAGSMPLEVEASDKLTAFDELTEINQSDIKFGNVAWKCKDKGDIIPISNTLLQDETANLTSYCGRRFAKKAVRTENADILTAISGAELVSGTTYKDINTALNTKLPVAIKNVRFAKKAVRTENADILTAISGAELVSGTTYKDINTALNTKLPVAIKNVAKIFTNQTGFDFLDNARDENGDPILTEDKASPSGYSYKHKHIVELDDAELVTEKPTFYVGSMEDYLAFFDRDVYEMAASDQAGFTKNATLLRVIERYDVQKVDGKALVKVEITIGG